MSTVLAADIGGTNIRLAIVDADGRIHDKKRIHAELSRQNEGSRDTAEQQLIDTLREACVTMLAAHDSIAVGIGFPGFFRGDSGVLASSPNLPLLEEFPLAERLASVLNRPVSVQNDALCAAVGEHRFGIGRDNPDLLHITLGTGIGGGLILNQVPYSGSHGMAMEFGHLRVVHGPDARPCGCGGRGCVEAYASATAVAARFGERSGRHGDTRAIAEMAARGDADARAVLAEAGHYLGMALAESIKLIDIDIVSISGGLTGAWELMQPALQQGMNEGLIPPLRGKIRVERSILKDNAGILGAAVLARETGHD